MIKLSANVLTREMERRMKNSPKAPADEAARPPSRWEHLSYYVALGGQRGFLSTEEWRAHFF
jgi:hypothetical protein